MVFGTTSTCKQVVRAPEQEQTDCYAVYSPQSSRESFGRLQYVYKWSTSQFGTLVNCRCSLRRCRRFSYVQEVVLHVLVAPRLLWRLLQQFSQCQHDHTSSADDRAQQPSPKRQRSEPTCSHHCHLGLRFCSFFFIFCCFSLVAGFVLSVWAYLYFGCHYYVLSKSCGIPASAPVQEEFFYFKAWVCKSCQPVSHLCRHPSAFPGRAW